MGVFILLLVIFTAAMGILTGTLYGILALTKLSLANYEVAGRWSFGVSFVGIVGAIVLAGSSYAIVCTWISGISALLILAMLISLLIRSTNWR